MSSCAKCRNLRLELTSLRASALRDRSKETDILVLMKRHPRHQRFDPRNSDVRA